MRNLNAKLRFLFGFWLIFHINSSLFKNFVVILQRFFRTVKEKGMVTIETVCDLQNYLFDRRKEGKSVGLVPTMGALHAGHGSLIGRASDENGVTVVSVFLNPTQFNDKSDLERYPRTLDADCRLAERMGADVVFAPSVSEMYPEPDRRQFSFPPTTEVMEGARRPGHFNGVCQVVSRLFYMTRPDRAYFGEKDFQQIAVVKRLVAYLGMKIEIVECPVVREADGLAMSSRNTLLKPEERAIAPAIYRVLQESVAYAESHSVDETRQYAIDKLNATAGLEVEYFSIVDAQSLLDVHSWDEAEHIAGCTTVYCGATPIRLIDHIRFK